MRAGRGGDAAGSAEGAERVARVGGSERAGSEEVSVRRAESFVERISCVPTLRLGTSIR